jgi:transposase
VDILAAGARFAPPPWTDDAPQRLDLQRRLDPDHLARRIERAVLGLDLSAFLRGYGRTGSLPHRPDLLLRAVLYEVQRGHHSPAQWHREARESEPLRWLLRGCQPSRAVWYAFRDRIAPFVDEWNRQVLARAVADGLTPARRGALDGTLVAANASRHRLVSEKTLAQRAEQLARAGDAADRGPPPRPAWMAATPRGRRRQQQRLRRAQERMRQLQERNRRKRASKRKGPDQVRLSPSDPEAALGRDKDGVYRPLYNVQVLDDLDSPLVLAYDVWAQPNDAGVLGAMLGRQAWLVGRRVEELLVDTAYAAGADLAAAGAAGVTVYAPLPEEAGAGRGKIPKSAFAWLPQEQTYRCPQGQRLRPAGSSRQQRSGTAKIELHQYRCPAEYCVACPQKERCTSRPDKGRTISRSEYEEQIEALRERMGTAPAKALYRQRRQTVELVNADWKEHRRLRRFSGRGLLRVGCQVGLMVLVHNGLTVLAARKEAAETAVAQAPLPEITAA